jgi:hypothetical protein
MRSKLACVLAGCGFEEAASECKISCPPKAPSAMDIDAIVQAVIQGVQAAQSR